MTDLLVRRDDFALTEISEGDRPQAQDGQAVLRVDAFGLTANNVTYAVFGEAMNYWGFFPAPEGFGRVPVWGFATVEESRHPDVAEGRRVFGYLPMSERLLIEPSGVDERILFDGSAHRAPLPTPYNRYSWTEPDPAYSADHEDAQMLLWPLFYTSWLLDDFLGDKGLFGAGTVIISSASSKTAIGAAFQLRERNGHRLIGLTGDQNREFVEGLGIYSEVVGYEQIGELEAADAVYVDVSGNARARKAVHERFGSRLAYSCAVGASHWQGFGEDVGELPGPAPQLFFAPNQVAKRTDDWGADGLDARFTEAWKAFVPWTEGWLRVEHGTGFDAISTAWHQVLEGTVPPDTAQVLRPA